MKKTVFKSLALMLVVAMVGVLVVACAPASNPDKAKKALEDNDYVVVKLDNYLNLEGVDCVVTGTKGLLSGDPQSVTIVYFEDNASAKDAWDEIKDKAGEGEDVVIKKSGKMIYFGTKQAIKDAK